jgi:type I protein arginine methyltransferase
MQPLEHGSKYDNQLTSRLGSLSSDLDLIDTIKLVNYIRTEVKSGNKEPDVSSKSLFDDDIYLKPVLEDDPLLYSLEDLEDGPDTAGGGDKRISAEKRVVELQEELERLRGQFSEYRLAVQRSIDVHLLLDDDEKFTSSGPGLRRDLTGKATEKATGRATEKATDRAQEVESDYFTSYSYNGAFSHAVRWPC